MIVAVADTHAALWYLYRDPRLGKAALAFIELAIVNGYQIAVSAISLAEMVYLVEKARIPASAVMDTRNAITDRQSVLVHIPVDHAVAMEMPEVSRKDIPDLPDRIIAATARMLQVPVLSRDGRIRASNIHTIWSVIP